MNENLPIQVDPIQESGTITYATEVIAIIVGVATNEVEGVAGMAGVGSISELLGGGSRTKNLLRGVKVEVGAEEVSVDVSIIVDYGVPIQMVSRDVQENIRKSIENMTGLHVIKVDVHVQGVSFEKENKELQQGQEVARLETSAPTAALNDAPKADKKAAPKAEPKLEPEEPAVEIPLAEPVDTYEDPALEPENDAKAVKGKKKKA